MALPKITESMIRAGAAPESFHRGEEYSREGAISNTAIQGSLLSGECAGRLVVGILRFTGRANSLPPELLEQFGDASVADAKGLLLEAVPTV